jgi:adenylate cyclase
VVVPDWDAATAAWHDRSVRVHRSFAFVDVSGFTALTELEGDEHAVDVLTAFRALLRDICGRRGVRIAKWLGDGVMLVCVDTTPLLAAIIELHYVVCAVSGPVQTVSIRSGVTSGDVILMEGDDYIGHCVNVAARLCDLAQGGEALAAPSVLSEMPRWGAVLARQDITLRGVERPVPTSSIGMPTAALDGRRDPICGLPLSVETAEETALDARGTPVLFCSLGCLDTWSRRPHPAPLSR